MGLTGFVLQQRTEHEEIGNIHQICLPAGGSGYRQLNTQRHNNDFSPDQPQKSSLRLSSLPFFKSLVQSDLMEHCSKSHGQQPAVVYESQAFPACLKSLKPKNLEGMHLCSLVGLLISYMGQFKGFENLE